MPLALVQLDPVLVVAVMATMCVHRTLAHLWNFAKIYGQCIGYNYKIISTYIKCVIPHKNVIVSDPHSLDLFAGMTSPVCLWQLAPLRHLV